LYRAEDIIKQATHQAEKQKSLIILQANEEKYKIRESVEKEFNGRRRAIEEAERKLQQREKNLDNQSDYLSRKEQKLANQEKEIAHLREEYKKRNEEIEEIVQKQMSKLERIAGLSTDDARKILFKTLEQDTKLEAVHLTQSILMDAKENAVKEAKKIVTEAIQKVASDHTVESTISVVNLDNEDIKGRIIGRDGRNIKVFETLTGVKVIVDDTPEAVVLSGFDPVRREIARISLEKLIRNGKINPQRVEQIVKQSEKEMEQIIWKVGNETIREVGVGKVYPEIVKMLGRLKYRTSYGQNVLQHSKEVAFLTGAMAAELRFDVKLAKRAGLLHDIGKAVSQNSKSTHTQIGVELAKKYKEHPVVVNAIASHHEDEDPLYPISILVSAADSISGSRPGARRETLEGYVRRIDRLEKLADSFDGVSKSYAISAGREIRVIVEPEEISDDKAFLLASDIAHKIKSDMEYPGHIKVTVIRETRAIQYI
ncbi:MAG TPA: ribonuclease Y, partial [Bacteroidetes bacterium]|nr:ribonuclease Y [Bacteroidota bacterium]